MSVVFLVSTRSPELQTLWCRQLPAARVVVDIPSLREELLGVAARVWVRDVSEDWVGLETHEATVQIVVGEPRSLLFVEAQRDVASTLALSIDASRSDLRAIASVAAELTMKRMSLLMIQRRPAPALLAHSGREEEEAVVGGRANTFDFLETAIEKLEDRESVVDVFQRGLRSALGASRVMLFLGRGAVFVANREGWSIDGDSPWVFWLKGHAALVDEDAIASLTDPAREAMVRSMLAQWNARLVVPIEIRGRLGGWAAFGPRGDARPYTRADRHTALGLVRLLARVLDSHAELDRAKRAQREVALLNQFGPKFRLMPEPPGPADLELPVEVRDTLGRARREEKRVDQEWGGMRVIAGPAGGQGYWVQWDEHGGKEDERLALVEAARVALLRDLGIILSHDLNNALLSVSVFAQNALEHVPRTQFDFVARLGPQVEKDLKRLRDLPRLLEMLHEMGREDPLSIDVKRLVEGIAKDFGASVETCEGPVSIRGHELRLKDAITWLSREILESAQVTEEQGAERRLRFTVQRRSRENSEALCVLTIGCPGLNVDQLRVGEPEKVKQMPTAFVYLAREVIRAHNGTINVGQGIETPELHITLKSAHPPRHR